MTLQLEETETKGRAYFGNAEATLAEMTYSKAGNTLIIIDHTEVSEPLKGTGVGRQLLNAIVQMAREQGKKILPLCPFANSIFQKDASIRDVLQ